ncbi:hypothetical protein TIFTF001_032933 [Ficus carica]|uniref:Uncharacterized protein n=1 Tax=Ficus carica TaxID=3494 RepID=A0AA88J317_FICCA|nr:hypothetical protein TIFTF001_032933 [Ficus carica]
MSSWRRDKDVAVTTSSQPRQYLDKIATLTGTSDVIAIVAKSLDEPSFYVA